MPHPSKGVQLPSPKPTLVSGSTVTAPSRPNVERHVSFSPVEPKRRHVPPRLEGISTPESSVCSEESTLVASPSPLMTSVDLPPLENMPHLSFEPVQQETPSGKVKGIPGLGPPPVSFVNPFKSRRWSASSSAKASASPRLDDVPPSPTPSNGSGQFSSKAESGRSFFPRHFSLKGRRPSSPGVHRCMFTPVILRVRVLTIH